MSPSPLLSDVAQGSQTILLIILPSDNEQNFSTVLGAIYGTHIAINAPKNYPKTYVNRKGFFAIILQGICREDLRFIYCVARWHRSCHDARVLNNTDIWENGLRVCGNGNFLGNGAYLLRKWLLTPYRDTERLTPHKRNYNCCHSGTRLTVERAFV